jgi:hypothetical protein
MKTMSLLSVKDRKNEVGPVGESQGKSSVGINTSEIESTEKENLVMWQKTVSKGESLR